VEADGVWGGQGRGYEKERDVSPFGRVVYSASKWKPLW
jgi:hypothetical protein